MSTSVSPILVSTIIATMAAPERAHLLKRAIESIRRASIHPIKVIVVVNGNRSDAALCAWLKIQPDVRLELIPTPSLPNAILRGRDLVETEFFTTLDDDDEFLEGGIDLRLAAMRDHSLPDVVVTNGYRSAKGLNTLTFDNLKAVSTAPLAALFQETWLQSCNSLYRSTSVGPAYFADYHDYAEWTWLAYKLALAGKRIFALEAPTYLCHDTPASLSKSKAYAMAYTSLFDRMLALQPPRAIVQQIRRRRAATWHDHSVQALNEGKTLQAILCHLRSLPTLGGARYLSYTRRLLPGWPKG